MSLQYAKTSLEKAKGFMGRDSIEHGEGILFMDIRPGAQFHMRTVKMPLAIAALDDEYQVIEGSVSVMEPQNGGWTAPAGTCHVLECDQDTAKVAMVNGEEPHWLELFGVDGPELKLSFGDTRKIKASNRSAEMTKQIILMSFPLTDDAEIPEENVKMLSSLLADDYDFKGLDIGSSEMIFDQKPGQGERDKEYYGSGMSDDLSKHSIAKELLESIFGECVKSVQSQLRISRSALTKSVDLRKILADHRTQFVWNNQ